jgi:hypothetical protein
MNVFRGPRLPATGSDCGQLAVLVEFGPEPTVQFAFEEIHKADASTWLSLMKRSQDPPGARACTVLFLCPLWHRLSRYELETDRAP